jgi:hypothetical protein
MKGITLKVLELTVQLTDTPMKKVTPFNQRLYLPVV